MQFKLLAKSKMSVRSVNFVFIISSLYINQIILSNFWKIAYYKSVHNFLICFSALGYILVRSTAGERALAISTAASQSPFLAHLLRAGSFSSIVTRSRCFIRLACWIGIRPSLSFAVKSAPVFNNACITSGLVLCQQAMCKGVELEQLFALTSLPNAKQYLVA